MSRKNKYSYEDMVNIFNKANFEVLISKDKYNNSQTLVNYKCKVCGHESKCTLSNVILGRKCNKCKRKEISDKRRYTYEFVKQCFEDRGCILLSTEYINNKTPLEYICLCGEYNKVSFKSFLVGNYCNYCKYDFISNKNRLDINDVRNFYKKQGCELLEDKYINNHTLMKYRCSCGTMDYKDFDHFKRGQRCDYCLHKSRVENNTKEKHPQWNHSLTNEERILRRGYSEYQEWVKSVLKRDDYTCQCCEKRGGKLNVHHLNSYANFPELRLDINNGVTLCEKCHSNQYENSFHRIYGTHNNTKKQFIEWLNLKGKYFNEADNASFFYFIERSD